MDSLHLDDERSNNKMISTPREKVFQAKQDEGDTNESSNKLISKQPIPPPSSISSSRQWSGLISRNPRIVRVSRSFGGKDRHSKVCTIRGLRDRRIRLSIPTAIQLYDLQDRLGLTQPSKVIDWLLDVTKHDIDNLPPLQIPQGLLGHNQQQPTMHSVDQWDLAAPSASVMMRAKGKEVERDHDQDDQDKNAMPLLNPYIYYHNWEPSNLSLSQQAADQNSVLNSNVFPFFCPPSAAVATMPSVFPTYVQEGTHDDQSSRQLINHFQLWSSSNSSQQVKPFSLNVNPGHTESNPGKEDT